jgi:predicted phage terminase large subunit-like protein
MTDNPLANLVPMKYCPHMPTPHQAAGLLMNDDREVFYGGAAGGGKSDWLLMAALQYVMHPGYSALLLRRTFQQLSKPGGLLSRAEEWLHNTDAKWSGVTHQWRFPSGATLELGHLQHENDKYNYTGSEYQFVGFDELTHFSETQYKYLFSRTRRLKQNVHIPIRMRGASNPGGEGHDWVKEHFVLDPQPGKTFLPAKLQDNFHLDQAEYMESLDHLDGVTKAQLLEGNWDVRPSGGLFKREDFEIVDSPPAKVQKRVRAWDFAATEQKEGTDPDWTVGALVSKTAEGTYYIEDIIRKRTKPAGVERLVRQTAELDTPKSKIWFEQEPGSSGKMVVHAFVKMLGGRFDARGERATGSKVDRASIMSAQVAVGNVKLVAGPWVSEFLREAEAFPFSSHDDQVDATSLAFAKLHRKKRKVRVSSIG